MKIEVSVLRYWNTGNDWDYLDIYDGFSTLAYRLHYGELEVMEDTEAFFRELKENEILHQFLEFILSVISEEDATSDVNTGGVEIRAWKLNL